MKRFAILLASMMLTLAALVVAPATALAASLSVEIITDSVAVTSAGDEFTIQVKVTNNLTTLSCGLDCSTASSQLHESSSALSTGETIFTFAFRASDSEVADGKAIVSAVIFARDGVGNEFSGRADDKPVIFTLPKTSIEDCDVTLSWTETTYDGTSQVPDVTVTHGGSMLTPGVDYDVTILDKGNSPITEAIHAGNYKLHISGKGDYRGDLDKAFTIQRCSINDGSVAVEPIALAVYTGIQLEPAVTVKFQDVALTQDVDYTLGYRDNVETGTGYVIISGAGDFSGMREESFGIVSEGDLSRGSIDEIDDQEFTGSRIEPALKVYLPLFTEPLRPGVDYEAAFSGNEDVGTAYVTVTGKGGIQGSLTMSFTIVEADISKATVSVADQVYDGTPLRPIPEITWNGIPLVLDKDFEVTGYFSNIGPGPASVQVAGKGNFTGTANGNFTIQAPTYSLEVVFGGLYAEYRFGELAEGQFYFTNTGAALGEVTITCGLTGETWTIPELDAGGGVGGFFNHLVTYADVEAGSISTAVSVTAKGPNGEDVAVTITDATAKVVPTPAAITLDLGEGELDGQTGTIIIDANVGQTIKLPAGTPTLAGHTFQYWQGSEYYPGDDYVVDGDHTLKAVFTKNQPTIPDTGDATPVALALAVALLAASAFGMVLARRRG